MYPITESPKDITEQMNTDTDNRSVKIFIFEKNIADDASIFRGEWSLSSETALLFSAFNNVF